MTDFERIKRFFKEFQGRFVNYEVIDGTTRRADCSIEYVCANIINNPSVKDFFVLYFPFESHSVLVDIDSLDSFVFEIYFINYGDKIVIHDACRTFDCGADSPEGNGVIAAHKEVVDRYLQRNGVAREVWAIVKETSLETFVQDTVTFVKVLQTMNNAQPTPPYLLELDAADKVVAVLTRCWIRKEKREMGNEGRRVAIFDNQKILQEHFTCGEQAYPWCFNKLGFVGLFFNSDGKVLVRKNKAGVCDFAICDYVLEDEWDSLSGLQRAIKENFGFEFSFGDVAPTLTTTRDKLICDFYAIHGYDVEIAQLCASNANIFAWMEKEQVRTLLKNGEFARYSASLVDYLFE